MLDTSQLQGKPTDLEFSVDDRQMRRLLAAVRRANLMRLPAAQALRNVMHSASLAAALRKLVETTFGDYGYMGSRYAHLIVRADIEAEMKLPAVAAEMGLSRRQFFRYRANAVRMLALQLTQLARDNR